MTTDMMNTMRLNRWSFIALAASVLVTLPTSSRAVAAEPPAPPEPIAIWPGDAPGEKGDVGAEYNTAANKNKVRITNVTPPTIPLRRPAADKDTGAAVLVCPGGAYAQLAM